MRMLIIVTAAALVVCSTAHALDFGAMIVDAEGKPSRECVEMKPNVEPPECLRTAELTLARASRNALYAQFRDEQNLTGEEKYKRAELAHRIPDSGDVKIKPEDAALLKKLIAKLYSPLIVFQAWNMLDDK